MDDLPVGDAAAATAADAAANCGDDAIGDGTSGSPMIMTTTATKTDVPILANDPTADRCVIVGKQTSMTCRVTRKRTYGSTFLRSRLVSKQTVDLNGDYRLRLMQLLLLQLLFDVDLTPGCCRRSAVKRQTLQVSSAGTILAKVGANHNAFNGNDDDNS